MSKLSLPRLSYVYAYLRAVTSSQGVSGSPYYIGKGIGKRAWSKFRGEIHPPKDKSLIVILKDNLSDLQAMELERQLILQHGRIDLGTGCLRNRTEGGDGTAGLVRSELDKQRKSTALKAGWQEIEFRQRMLDAQKKTPHARGYKRMSPSAETRLRLSKAAKTLYMAGLTNLPDNTGRVPWNKGRSFANVS
jgi:hypothetical protein